MAGFINQIGDLNKLKNQAKQMQKELAAEEIIVERGDIIVKITGGQEIKDISVQNIHSDELVKALNEAIKKSQEVAAKKLQSMTGGLGALMGK
ncbi:MAG TPA: YbaB/EbfC family nucleoid-associated protein [Candidatus Woesebacteria bacterium]|nr:YbaB/EbfC family nucleoid-associated protein [Candidatus Woesebacteria bacterium]